jgi:hypothetical protein
MENNYCCPKFSFFYSGDKRMGLNISIFKYSEQFRERGQLDNNLIFFITDGYENIDESKKMVISYCPFCGIRLNTFYLDEKYVQGEIDI